MTGIERRAMARAYLYNPTVRKKGRARHSRRDRLTLSLSLLRDPVFDCLLSSRSAFDDLPATMARLAAEPGGALCHVVVYS